MRLFVAVDIDDRTRGQLGAARDAIQGVISHARVPARVTWVRDESAHVTLRFIGEVADAMLPRIHKALRRLTVTPFDVTWDTVGTFGGIRRPRVIWVGPAEVSDAFHAIDQRVNARLDPILGPAPPREFKPHVTLGRIKVPGKGVDWETALAFEFPPCVTRVDHVTLYQSRLSSKGPTYTSLSTYG